MTQQTVTTTATASSSTNNSADAGFTYQTPGGDDYHRRQYSYVI